MASITQQTFIWTVSFDLDQHPEILFHEFLTSDHKPSRWDGLATTAILTFLCERRFIRSRQTPKWYFTSPEPSSAGSRVENWHRMVGSGCRQTFARIFNRPLKKLNHEMIFNKFGKIGLLQYIAINMSILQRNFQHISNHYTCAAFQ